MCGSANVSGHESGLDREATIGTDSVRRSRPGGAVGAVGVAPSGGAARAEIPEGI